MEEQLLILGLLRSHEMHGYQLHEALADREITAVPLSKANAYKLLRKLETEGFVAGSPEQAGNRPPRRVYRITPAGEAAFQTMLRSLLAEYAAPEFPSLVALNFLNELSPAECITLLHRRRESLLARLDWLTEMPAEVRETHLSPGFFQEVYQMELVWLDALIAQQQTSSVDPPAPPETPQDNETADAAQSTGDAK